MNDTAVKIEQVVEHYDRLADWSELKEYYSGSDYLNFGYFEEDTKSQKEACENMMDQLLSCIPDKSGTILDVACGKGATTAYLLRYYPPEAVTGINISDRQLEIARQNAPGVKFLNMSAMDMSFPEESFDNMICVEAIFHFVTRTEFLKSVLRMLKPGGSIVFSDMLMTWDGEERRPRRTTENFIPDLDSYRSALESIGFSTVTVEDITEQSWRRHYRHATGYFHEQFLAGKITRDELSQRLHETYERVPDLKYYLKVCCQK
ncbi:MAG: methyltransferase domain-containing protein [Halioglobus sp.]|nr:methyltransferase domain-containing protein [Halioglobus sp.]